MSEPTMNKEDVKLEYDTLSALDWTEIQTVCGVSPPTTAKALFLEVSKKLKAKAVKKPYAKVGLIKGNMYLRFKDGSTHLGDTLLTKNWTPPAAAAPVDAKSRKIADDFIDERKALKTAVDTGKDVIKQLSTQVAALRERIEGMLKTAQKGGAPQTMIAEAAQVVTGATHYATQAHTRHDDQVYPLFSQHRTMPLPKNIDLTLVAGYDKEFFLTVGTEYTKLTNYLKTLDSDLEQIQEIKLSIDRLVVGGQDAAASKRQSLQRVADEVRAEFDAMKAALDGTKTLDRLAPNLRDKDIGAIRDDFAAGNQTTGFGRAEASTVKVQKAAANFKIMQKHHARLNELAEDGRKAAKDLSKDPAAKITLKQIEDDVKAAKTFADQQQAYMKDGLTAYAELKKFLSAKGQQAA